MAAEMILRLPKALLLQIQAHGEQAYPEEGAGFLIGADAAQRTVEAIFRLSNAREDRARRNRYLIAPEDYLKAELEAGRRRASLIGVFHSHPDHPDRPSEYDREWAQPFFSYLISSIEAGRAAGSRSWRLSENRLHFLEEEIQILE